MKIVGSVLRALYGPVLGFIVDGPKGALQGLKNAVAAYAGGIPGYALYVGSAALRGLLPTQKPETATSSIKNPIPPRVRAYGALRLYGAWIFYGNDADGAPVDVWVFHDGQMSAVLQVYLNNDKVTISGGAVQALDDGSYKDGKVLAGYSLGLPTETAFAAVVAALPGVWTTDHRGDGVVTGYMIKKLVKAKQFQDTYPSGDNLALSLAGEWSLVYDFRDIAQDPDDPATWEYRANPVLAFLHYLMTQRGVDFTAQVLPQITAWTAAANDCDDAQPLAAGGTEPRYRLSLAYKATDEPGSVIAALLECFDGWYCVNERNEIVVYSGRYYEPTVDIGPGQIVSYTFQEFVAAEDAVNEITVAYVSSLHDYNTVDAQAWRDESAIAASGREPVSGALGVQIPSYTQGRRLAKRRMSRANAPRRGTCVTTYSGRSVMGQRYINLRLVEAGAEFIDGPVEIIGPPERDMTTGGVRFEWVEANPLIDDWTPAIDDGYGAPVGDYVPIAPLTAPAITTLTVSHDDDSGADAPGVRVLIDATGPDRDDLTWYARWRVQGTDLWQTEEHDDIDAGAAVQLLTGFVPVNRIVEVQISYLTGDGRLSDWSTPTETVDTTITQLTGGGELLTGGGELLIEG